MTLPRSPVPLKRAGGSAPYGPATETRPVPPRAGGRRALYRRANQSQNKAPSAGANIASAFHRLADAPAKAVTNRSKGFGRSMGGWCVGVGIAAVGDPPPLLAHGGLPACHGR